MLTDAFSRALRAVPPARLDEVRPGRGHEYAFYCSTAECSRCADFAHDGRAAFEARLPPTTRVLDWKCDNAALRDAALAVGVRVVPSYVFVPASGDASVKPVV